jgi:glyoxylase I family protein
MTGKITGIGGFFFRAKNPEALGKWYHEHFGITLAPSNYSDSSWWQEAGPTVFAPFLQETEYFGSLKKAWMINFRVDDLNAIVGRLRDANIIVRVDAANYPNGRFARLCDPEGNPLQLWEAAVMFIGKRMKDELRSGTQRRLP